LETKVDVLNKDQQWLNNLVSLFHDRMSYGAEIITLYEEFFETPFLINDAELNYLKQDGVIETLRKFKENLQQLTEFNAENIQTVIKETGKQTKAKGKMLFMPCRIATTAQMHGPELPKMLELLGKEAVILRLTQTLTLLAA
jgi:nondiscriminating glutamyl-tRNA synthetase